MIQLKHALLVGAAGAALLAAPLAATAQTSTTIVTNSGTTVYPAPATTGSITTVTTTTTMPGSPHLADPVAHLESLGYSDVEQTPGVALESEMAFKAANEWGHPVTVVIDKETGDVVRETSSRTLNKPSKQ
ncbi:hypothetical protein Plav_3116 [Parvibaculum lavamentivorans DS-1]|uniref:PepSY domain-containing protein n=1 Tax=Parvibaculum lavamentivorans (strain DS-1 / DSM 13023 / NCIMB 13966) TaxID=402881 RepID=A7HXU0_PARL1|nr:hypothetical protein [Parvibaculum lavamentivorans]ABS64723.1 hypothetical protein Plav_3116 [Parvibaculum lavamentivorans DS-1]